MRRLDGLKAMLLRVASSGDVTTAILVLVQRVTIGTSCVTLSALVDRPTETLQSNLSVVCPDCESWFGGGSGVGTTSWRSHARHIMTTTSGASPAVR